MQQNNVILSLENSYKIASIIQTYPNNYQVIIYPEESKRKVKLQSVLYTLKSTDLANFSKQIDDLSNSIDNQLLYELLDDNQLLTIEQLASLYFGDSFDEIEKTALLFKLSQDSIYYTNHCNGSFNKNTKEQVNKYQQEQAQALLELNTIEMYYQNIITNYNEYLANDTSPIITNNLNLPDIDIIKLLNNPDKDSLIYKAFHKAEVNLNTSLTHILYAIGLIKNIEEFFYNMFIKKTFRSGISYQTLGTYSVIPDLSTTLNRVFSIDDSTTNEIDDAFSVEYLNNGYKIGVHIAAPALDHSLARNVIDQIATIYYPGDKITMLGYDVIKAFSLDQGMVKPVVSLYFNIDLEYNVLDYETKIESLSISDNLRIEQLDTLWDDENNLIHPHTYAKELQILHKFAKVLEQIRGKANVNHDVDYNFSFINQKIKITPRKRGTPVDKLVSELMILANSTWGRILTNNLIPALYRSKQPNYPVITTMTPLSHIGLNVDYYTWASSPLRRGVDYINQAQLIALITQTEGLPKEYVFELAEIFDSQYSKYLEFQNKMERYWSLKYLLQEQVSIIKATFVYKSKAILDGVPITINLEGIMAIQPRNTSINIKIFNINLINLTFEFKVIKSD